MDWEHPTENEQPKEVLMLLLGESKKDYANMLSLAHNNPFPNRPEIWTCNAGLRIWDHDLLWVMDDLACHDRPIMTSAKYDEFDQAVEYPFMAICKALNLKGLDRYFYNTVPYMLAYALYIGVQRITLFGADYYHPNSPGREADLANCEWWLGFLRAKGVNITLAHDTTLMRARDHAPLYGYRFDPRIAMDRLAQEVNKPVAEEVKRPARLTAKERYEQAAARMDGFGDA